MRHHNVGTLMESDVVSVTTRTPFKDAAKLLAEHRISGLPVVDEDEVVVGVLSEGDLMLRQASQEPERRRKRRPVRLPWMHLRRKADAAQKGTGLTAGDLMSAPAVVAGVEQSIAEAARSMAKNGVKRLPVVDRDGHLVGIVSRRDLLEVFLRPDAAIRLEVLEALPEWAIGPSPDIDVHVLDGVVTLKGHVEQRSDVSIALRLAEQVDGVVAVVDQLAFRVDDSRQSASAPAPDAAVDERFRGV